MKTHLTKYSSHLKTPRGKKNGRPLKLTANMIINVKPLKVFPIICGGGQGYWLAPFF